MDIKNILEIAEDKIISDLCFTFWELNNKIISSPDNEELKQQQQLIKDKIDEMYKIINKKE
tara:strand:+ start:5748 stop:5930 length:183 start_codon:yes stop_codon:yes gene_type:complete